MQSSRVLPFSRGLLGIMAAVSLAALGGGGACGGGGGKGTGGTGGGTTPGALCSGDAPWTTSGAPAVTLTVDAASPGAAWNRFYEGAVATDHANTILAGAWGRNAQNALKKGHDEAGFRYARFHGIFNDDIGVYSEPGGTPTYNWTRLDQVYDAVIAAGMRPMVEVSFMPKMLGSGTQTQPQLWYNGMSPNISPPKDWARWQAHLSRPGVETWLAWWHGTEEGT